MKTTLGSLRLVWVTAACCTTFTTAQTPIATVQGDAAGDAFGRALAAIDIDGDGIDELAIGAPLSDAAFADGGRVTIVSLLGTLALTIDGSAVGEELGSSLAVLGNVDADAAPDLLIGVPGRGANGAVAAHSGQTGAELYDVTHAGPGTMGHVLATGGHVDVDGIGDFVAPSYSSPWGLGVTGVTTVHSGADGTLVRTHAGSPGFGDPFRSAAFLADLDGNGLDEYVLGGIAGQQCASEVAAYRGADGTLIWSDTGSIFTEYGFAVLAPGDLDSDSLDDVLGFGRGWPLGCFGTGGVARALSGPTGALLSSSDQDWGGDFLELVPIALGDLDGDGLPEHAVASEGIDVRVYSGLDADESLVLPAPAFGGFGRALAVGDFNGDGLTDLAVGAPDAPGGGAVTIYTLVLGETTYCVAQTNSQGCVPRIHSTGIPSLTIGTLRIRASDVLNNKPGLLFWGFAPEAVPFLGGTLCVQPPIARTPVQFSAGNPPPDDCSGEYGFHYSGFYMTTVGLSAGDRVYTQYWARDPADPSGTNLTDAFAFVVEP